MKRWTGILLQLYGDTMISQKSIDAGCQVCGDAFSETTAQVVYDARTYTGQWAFLCEECFQDLCSGLGVGRGQKYDINTRENIEG